MFFSLVNSIKVLLTSLMLITFSVFTYSSDTGTAPTLLGNINTVESQKAMPHDVYLSVGGYVIARTDMTIALSDSELGAGLAISPRDTLGIDLEQTVARLDGRYRFTDTHSLSFAVYRITSNSNKITEKDFEWTNAEGESIVVKAGAEIGSEFSNTIVKLAYDWSFYHNEKIELYTSVGFNIAQIKLAMDFKSSVNESNNLSAEDVSLSLPLPTLGLGLNYRVNDVFYWYLKSQAFAIAINDLSASYSTSHFGFEYQPFKHVGLGLSYSVDKQTVNDKGSKTKLSYNNNLNGFNLYVSTYF